VGSRLSYLWLFEKVFYIWHKTKTIENLFSILHYASEILVILVFLIFVKQLIKDKGLVFILTYTLLDLLLNYYYRNINRKLYLYLWSTFTFVEYIVFTYFLWANIKSKIFRALILWLSAFFIVFTSIYNVQTNFRNIDSIPIGVETILILVYSFYYLYEQMNDNSTLFIYSKYQFWIVIGFLIYLAGSFFIFIFSSKWTSVDFFAKYWYVTNGFYAFMNLMFIIAFFMKAKKAPNLNHRQPLPFLN